MTIKGATVLFQSVILFKMFGTLVVAFVVVVSGVFDDVAATSNLSTLRASLFHSYDKLVMPDSLVKVQLGMTLLNVDVCPHKQILTTQGWLQLGWNDPRLAWNPADFNDIKVLRIQPDNLWIPDIVLYNGEQQKPGYITLPDNAPAALIYNNGDVLFVPPVSQRSICALNFDNWPWGVQNCSLIFGSWTYHMKLMDIIPGYKGAEPIQTHFFSNPQFEIISTSTNKKEGVYECCPDEVYPSMTFNIAFKQNTMFYHGKVHTQETEAKKSKKHAHKPDSSEEN